MERLDKSEKIFKVFSYTMVIIFALLALYPVLYAFSVSISGKVAYESGQIVLLPKDVTFQAYDMVLHNKGSGSLIPIRCFIRCLERRGVWAFH